MRIILFLCFTTALPLVSTTAVRLGKFNVHKYFSNPKGVRNIGGVSPRIVGGVEVNPHSYPSQAALLIDVEGEVYYCGGSLISNRWVLTTASCLVMTPSSITVVLGGHNSSEVDPSLVLDATIYVYHRDYDMDTFTNDVGLIKLPLEVAFTDKIKPAVLAEGSDRYDGKRGTIVGWGQTETGALSMVLKAVNVTVMTNDACAAVNDAYREVIQDMHICTSGEGNVGSCSGDTGGPLFVDDVQVGIISFGTANCSLGLPSVFTRVNDFYDWIRDTIAENTASTVALNTTVTPDPTDTPGGAAGLASLRLGVIALVALYFAQFLK